MAQRTSQMLDAGLTDDNPMIIDHFLLGRANCTTNFYDIKNTDEFVCVQNFLAPDDSIIDGQLFTGNCTDLTTPPPANSTIVTERNSTSTVVTRINLDRVPDEDMQFCLYTRILTANGVSMYYIKTPVIQTFTYNGKFTISAGVVESGIGDLISDKQVFTADAFVCNPDFTPNSERLSIGSVLYVCIQPNQEQRTTVIDYVNYFSLSQPGQPEFKAVATGGVANPVTIVVSEGTRKVVIGTRVPSFFFNSRNNVYGTGEAILGQERRLLRHSLNVSHVPRDLEEVGDEEVGDSKSPFTLKFSVDTYAMMRSASSSTLSRTKVSGIAAILSARFLF